MACSDVSCATGHLTFNPRTDLTDVALYSYSALCSYALGKLFEGSSYDRELVDKWINKIIEHNGQGDASKETMQALAHAEVQLDNADPFVESLKADPYLIQNGMKPVVQDLMSLAIQDGCYDSRLRTLVKYLCLLLKVDWFDMEMYENAIVENLQEEEHMPTEEEIKEKDSREKKSKIKRYVMIGGAAIGGGALLGLTGGLAAPFIAAGAGAIIGTAGATALASTAGIAVIGSLFGVAGAGLGGYKMKKRVGIVEEFEFEPISEGRQLHITIGISGWLTEQMPEFKTAWLGLANSKEQYVLKYESKYLLQLGKALDYLVNIAINAATQEALKYTVLSGLLAAIAWPATLLAASSIIDNPWSVCTHRTVNVGRQLADVLLSRQQGKRPVTLVGFSLGARVIYYCLQEMAKRKNCEGIIEDVFLFGAPVTGDPKEWDAFSRVVAGKVVNGYCRGDWLLKFLYRTASIQMNVAGLKAVAWENRRMHNIDLSDVVQGHTDYINKVDDILNVVGIKTREHAARRNPDSLKAWVQIQKSSSAQNLKQSKPSDITTPTVKDISQCDNTVQPTAAACPSFHYRSEVVDTDKSETPEQQGTAFEDGRHKPDGVGELGGRLATSVSCSQDGDGKDSDNFHDVSPLNPAIQSNNLSRHIQAMTLTGPHDAAFLKPSTQVTDKTECNLQSLSANSSTYDVSSVSSQQSLDYNESSNKQKLNVLEGIPGTNSHSNTSSQVTTPDSGISCDD